ncbi:D-glycero-alpha-D-manno-heptose-1,7-bisphosphate 7-phosphatase [Paramicrobacterium agarici]|uniref:D-glycero-alpha-D-manno-heptose-1,7-bisphosphate 7-phosphatase n=1 Tax=Paramicrobacterium agarici TaxID=630514 RepID=UPI001150FAB8|nr:HAD-IIIA family hydrolase [Microbacterium agarici]TQO21687.1 histidinol-phosphate phosphatase family protein/HAD superfamily hydrolase (TIGR01662 family) [Microbacterium agarici]
MTSTTRPHAVLFDRDDTLIENVPYNGDPAAVVPMPHARAALDRLREAGVKIGIVTNQSGVARGIITADQMAAVNRRVEDLLGPFDVVLACVHGPDDACSCRKPLPGLITSAAAQLNVAPEQVAVIGDIGSDMDAAAAAAARGILVPTDVTLPGELEAAPEVAADLVDAVARLLPEREVS